jgi:AraC-like DNA-binding protein
MFEQLIREDDLYTILYGASAMLSLVACCYLLFRRSNAIAPDITSPVHLRRWAAAFFASLTLSHLWYLPIFYLTSAADIMLCNTIGGTLDFLTIIPFAVIVLLSMLQDRRRPLWPAFVLFMPLVVGLMVCGVSRNYTLLPFLYVYYLLLGIGLIIYLIREVRQYGRWLRDNYADLEHKEVWQSFIVLAIILLVLVIYALESQAPVYQYITQLNGIVLVCYLVWRVETLSDLSIEDMAVTQEQEPAGGSLEDGICQCPPEGVDNCEVPQTIHDKIGPLLQKHCIDSQLYLQHDLSISQLAKAIGTNRLYLSQYFSRQGMTYNAYINSLRIDRFMSLYRQAVATQRHITARQLAFESGYRSYTTFSAAFKQLKGQTVTAWMREMGKES